MEQRQVIRNAATSVIQTIVLGCTLFFLYRFLLRALGPEQLGIWSLVLATTSVTQIANLGLSGSVVKFVARHIALGDYRRASAVVQTAALTVGAFIGSTLVLSYPAIKWLLSLLVPLGYLPLAHAVLPFALVALWLLAITAIFQAGLDGTQRTDIRSMLLMAGSALQLFLAFLFVPRFGLLGLAYIGIIQNSVILLSSWLILRRKLPSLTLMPTRWDRQVFMEIFRYGISFQAISLTTMLYDPTTKALLSKFGGLAMVAYFEMASRMIQQFRALLVSANQVLVPTIATFQERSPARVLSTYLTSYQLMFYLALPLFSLIIVAAPLISTIWIGKYEPVFVISTIFLGAGWFFNSLSAPAYFVNLGIGDLRWNLIGHIAIAFLNAALGGTLGILYGGLGVVTGWAIALALGSATIYVTFHRVHNIGYAQLLPKASIITALTCVLGIISIIILRSHVYDISRLQLPYHLFLLSFLIVVSLCLWFHPMRRKITQWLSESLTLSNQLLSREKGT